MDENFKSILAKRYLNNALTMEELEVFFPLLQQGEMEEPLARALEEKQHLLTQIQNTEKPIVGIPAWKRLGVVAAIALCILCAGWWFFMNTNTKPSLYPETQMTGNYKNDIPPGGNKATLTLDDGTVITLDSAKNGKLADQDNTTVLKMADGQLVYDGSIEHTREAIYNTLTVPKGGTYTITLADGTKVWLNAGSSLRYPIQFLGNDRRVVLTGEGYFDVVHNDKAPFVVNVGQLEVHDLGTSFNINAYHDEPVVAVTLVSGLAQVMNGGKSTALQPGTQAQVAGSSVITKQVDVTSVTAWKSDKFSFYQTGIHSIMRQIARWYDVEVEFRGTIDHKFDGEIYRTTQAQNVFKILEATGYVTFKVEGKKVIVMQAEKKNIR